MATDTRLFPTTRQNALPGTIVDGSLSESRANRYGELYTRDIDGGRQFALADEGSYFVATNPTAGTAIAGISAADGLDDLETLLFLRNDATASEGTRVYLDYILLEATAAGTNGTNFAYAMKVDTGSTRNSSGGSAITPKNTNMQSTRTPGVTMQFGAVVTTAASSSARLVSHGRLRTVIKVVADSYLFVFGQGNKTPLAHLVTPGTATTNIVRYVPPIVLGPTDQFFLHEFSASQTVAAQYQFECGFWVR